MLSLHIFFEVTLFSFFLSTYFLLLHKFITKRIGTKINNFGLRYTCPIAQKHKRSHFNPKATGLHDLVSSLKKSLQT